VALFAIVGCNTKANKPAEEKSGLHIEAPGVDVQVGGDQGVQVEAPGTDVDLKPGEGGRITAPGTDIRVDKEKQ
jgi:hypothetical protein